MLWPLFVHCYLSYTAEGFHKEARAYFDKEHVSFQQEHADDLRILTTVTSPEHVETNSLCQKYRNQRYHLSLTGSALQQIICFLEARKDKDGFAMISIISNYMTINVKERSDDARFGWSAVLGRANEVEDFPNEDEGIPGHQPGSAYVGDNRNVAGVLPKLKLGKLPLPTDVDEDVRAELMEEDLKKPVTNGNSLVQEYEQMIKKEDDEENPTRAEIPYPPSIARDVAMEVNKVKEHRNRFKIEGRTGGVGPAVSVCMFTFHNTYDG